MRWNLIVTAALLTLLTGLVTWVMQPTQKAFSWVELSQADYLIGYLPGAGVLPGQATATLSDFQDAIEALRLAVSGDYHVYAAIGRMGKRAHLPDGQSYPLFREEYVSDGFFAARGVHAQYGRLFQPDEVGAVVIGLGLAREFFGDPARAVGTSVSLRDAGLDTDGTTVQIVGVLSPSPAQDPDADTDRALVGNLMTELMPSQRNAALTAALPLFLHLTIPNANDVPHLLPGLEVWVSSYFGPNGGIAAINSVVDRRQTFVTENRPRIEARQRTFLLLGGGLVAAALLALVAQSSWYLLRRKQLLGVDKALGATRVQLLTRLILSQSPWGLLGGVLGWLALWSLHDLMPGLFLTRAPAVVTGVAVSAPIVALLLLAAVVGAPIMTLPAAALIRGRVEGNRLRSILLLVYGGLALALTGGLAANGVRAQVEQENEGLLRQFGSMYALQAGSPFIDDRAARAFEGGADIVPVFTPADAAALREVQGIGSAVLAQAIPWLEVAHGETRTTMHALVGEGDPYLKAMGLSLREGDVGGCVLSTEAATALSAALGDDLVLGGLVGPLACTVTGILSPYPALWSWLVVDLPDVVVPAVDGLGLALPGYTATPFRSTRVLLELSSAEDEARVRSWHETRYPNVRAEVIPYVPDVTALLANLRHQAQLFFLVAVLAAVLSLWGIVGGFLALLDAERFKIALDRALGLSLQRVAQGWWLQTLGWGVSSAALAVLAGHWLSQRLYDALALDIPNLPGRAVLDFRLEPVLVILLGLVVLSTFLSVLATRWFELRSTVALLKEGTT